MRIEFFEQGRLIGTCPPELFALKASDHFRTPRRSCPQELCRPVLIQTAKRSTIYRHENASL